MAGFLVDKQKVVILGGARTPFGSFGGSFSGTSATDLAVFAGKAGLEKSRVEAKDVSHVVWGNVIPSSPDAAYLARHVGLKLGVPQNVPALTLNRLCGSGFEAVTQGADQILLGRSDVVLAGGTENMTQAPFQLWNARNGIALGQQKMGDALWDGLRDSFVNMPMGVTAENLAKHYKISRQESDQFSLDSQTKTKQAQEKNLFKDEMASVILKHKGKELLVERDEHPRETSLEKLQKLSPVFDPSGVVTAGSSSGIVDGACGLVVASAAWAARKNLTPLGKIVAYAVCGCDPALMGIGPVFAAREALMVCGKTMNDMGLIEINEAFAPQVLAVQKELGIKSERLNVNGGAIAIGHPLAASGARLILTLLLEMRRRSVKYGLAAACIGGGQGIAIILET